MDLGLFRIQILTILYQHMTPKLRLGRKLDAAPEARVLAHCFKTGTEIFGLKIHIVIRNVY